MTTAAPRRDHKTKIYSEKEAHILDSALAVLHSDGAGEFGMRGVAREAGVSLRTVQHYFPSKQALFAAVISHLLSSYESSQTRIQIEALLDTHKYDKAIEVWVLSYIREAVSGVRGELFAEAITRARRDPNAKESLLTLRSTGIEFTTWLFQQCNSSLNKRTARRRATLAHAMISGLQPLIALEVIDEKELSGIRRELIKQVWHLINET